MTHTSMRLSRIFALHLDRQVVPHFVGPNGELSRNVAPGLACSSTLSFSSRPNWWQATKSAPSIRYVERIGSGPNRRCDTVTDPDFFES